MRNAARCARQSASNRARDVLVNSLGGTMALSVERVEITRNPHGGYELRTFRFGEAAPFGSVQWPIEMDDLLARVERALKERTSRRSSGE
jgi:hypothetical protein